MAEFPLTNTAQQVDDAIHAVVDAPNNTITSGSTELVTSGTVHSHVSLIRPKFVTLTGGTTDLNKITTTVGDQDYTYNIADFTSSDSDFGTSKIVALIINTFTSSSQSANIVQASLPNGVFTSLGRTSADSTGDFTQDSSTSNIPINSGQSSITIRHKVADAQTLAAQSIIQGAIIHPHL